MKHKCAISVRLEEGASIINKTHPPFWDSLMMKDWACAKTIILESSNLATLTKLFFATHLFHGGLPEI